MCGRFTLTTSAAEVAEHFGLDVVPELTPRFNVAPTQDVLTLRAAPGDEVQPFLPEMRHWGLLPRWAKDRSVASRLINARSETAAEKPAFRSALRTRRCLVPMDGYFEWKREGRSKRPHHVTLAQGDLFAAAGLYEHWRSKEGDVVESVTLLTQPATANLADLHSRMPVVVPREDWRAWLDPRRDDGQAALDGVDAALGERLAAREVDSWVNDARHQGPACLAPPGEVQPSLFGPGDGGDEEGGGPDVG